MAWFLPFPYSPTPSEPLNNRVTDHWKDGDCARLKAPGITPRDPTAERQSPDTDYGRCVHSLPLRIREGSLPVQGVERIPFEGDSMRNKLISGAALGLLLCVCASGCSQSLRDQVTGKWRHSGGALTVEFLKDGSFTGSAGPIPLSGTYTTPDEKHLKLEGTGFVGDLLGAHTYEAKVENDWLTLTAGTLRQDFTRQKQ
jgi:hypothetical protein